MRSFALAAALAGTAACGGVDHGPHYDASFASARRAESAGRFKEARDRYDEAAKGATRDRDRAYSSFSAARLSELSGDIRDATLRYEALAKSCPDPRYQHSAEFQLARIEIAHGDAEVGYAAMEKYAAAHPDDGLARRALYTAAAHKDETLGRRGTIAWLESKRTKLGATDLAEAVEYAIARRLHQEGALDEALTAYLAVADRFPYPFGRTWDDSLYHASEVLEERGNDARSAEVLERMLAVRETTTIMGTYDRPRFMPGMLRLVHLYAEKMKDDERAIRTLRRIHDDFKKSPWRDDALWLEALLLRGKNQHDAACTRVRALVSEFPESRFAPCVHTACPSSDSSPKGEKAERSCPTYADDFGRVLRGAALRGYTGPNEEP